ncbi:DUF2306 domain-containing protein [Aquisediminimonas profunda]|uniref:DUF2306 domain-containing protein n=1 Tax=Aquisediminimonas profunda TaxID=1550733 RepID=UPI001C62B114|nr:DUF2306 domain-containing protein [Aquisediminimonas profunda]
MDAAKSTNRPSIWKTRNGVLLAAALVTSAVAWWMIALPVATLSNISAHKGHFALTFAHMLGGSGMMVLGGFNLYLAAGKSRFPIHRRVGQGYLLIGTFGAILALIITLSPAHKTVGGPILTNSTISLSMLASAWLCFAALGWRAARNRKFASHGDWMVRSYVLVWSFVFCRVASRITNVGDLGNGEAFIRLSWVGPLILCEILLQWPRGSVGSRS